MGIPAGINPLITGNPIAPFPPQEKENQCFGLNPNLSGNYSGIHNGDNITPASTQEFERRVGKPDIELKFSLIEGGWVFPWEETRLLKGQHRTIFIKEEPYAAAPAGSGWEDIDENYEYLDRLIPGSYFNLLLDLTTLAKDTRAVHPDQLKVILSKYGINKINASLPPEISALVSRESNFIADRLTEILTKASIRPAVATRLAAEAERSNQVLYKAFRDILTSSGIASFTPNLLHQLVSKAKADQIWINPQDIKQQYLVILQQYGIDPAKLDGISDKLSAKAIAGYSELIQNTNAILKATGVTASNETLALLGKKSRGGYDPLILELDLILRRHGLAKNLSGEYDNIIRRNAQQAKAAGIPILDAFGPEMNGYAEKNRSEGGRYFYPWGLDPVKYVLAYRHVHDIKTEAGAKNITYVWNPHVIRRTEKDFTDYYPGDNYVDLIAFDVYCDREEKYCTSMIEYLDKSIDAMDAFLAEKGLQRKDYAIGEWGAASYSQFDQMLARIEGDPRIKFSIYYNVNEGGNYKMNPAMEARYQTYLRKLSADDYNFGKFRANPDIRPETCRFPQIPDPKLIYRPISPAEFQDAAEIRQRLEPFPAGWHPDTNQPSRSLTSDRLYPAEKAALDTSIGHAYDHGTHQYLLSANLLQIKFDKQELDLKTLRAILITLSSQALNPFDPLEISPAKFMRQHPELAKIEAIAPEFSAYLQQPLLFWENSLLLLNAYTRQAIERNDQDALRESIQMGEFFLRSIDAQNKRDRAAYSKANPKAHSKASFAPSIYQQAGLRLSLAEAYSALRDQKVEVYKKGLEYAQAAIEKYQALGKDSGIDYYSIAKGVLAAADLHSKIAQQYMRATEDNLSKKQENENKAKAEYKTAKELYDSLARLDHKNGIGLEVSAGGINLRASAAEILKSLEKNVDQYNMNRPEAVAGAHGIFRFLRGIALIKEASFFMEYAFKPFNTLGYEDVIQNLVLVNSGLEEIENGSPFADLRYFRALGNLLLGKLSVQFADSVAYSASEMADAAARQYYKKAAAVLRAKLPHLFPPADWAEINELLAKNDAFDSGMVKQEMAYLTDMTRAKVPVGGVTKIKDVSTPDMMAQSEGLFQQIFSLHNFRKAFADKLLEGYQERLETAKAQLLAPNRFGKDDNLEDKAAILYAELLLAEVDLDLRRSEFTYFKNETVDRARITGLFGAGDASWKLFFRNPDEKALVFKTGAEKAIKAAKLDSAKKGQLLKLLNYSRAEGRLLKGNAPKISGSTAKDALKKIDLAERLLPKSSYLRLELAFMRATLKLSLESFEENADYRKKVYATVSLLAATPPIFSEKVKDPSYETIQELEGLRSRIMAQPEPNRTILLNQLEAKLALAYIILAANIINSFKGEMKYVEKCIDEPPGETERTCKQALDYAQIAAAKAKDILITLETRSDRMIAKSGNPLLFNLHDFRAEVYHQLAIVFAVLREGPQMQHYLALAKEENLNTDTGFNLAFRSWILNNFAIPNPNRSKGTGIGLNPGSASKELIRRTIKPKPNPAGVIPNKE